ncbi:MAG: hypothetical protein WAM97_20625 [Acidimicrobiales bacterium]
MQSQAESSKPADDWDNERSEAEALFALFGEPETIGKSHVIDTVMSYPAVAEQLR